MYPFEWLVPAWERLWSLVHRRAPWTPPALRWDGDPHDHWRDPRCLVAQACGWPVMTELRDDVSIAGAFTLALDDADGHRYCSVVVANRPIDLTAASAGEITAAVNAIDSLSGWISLLDATVGAGKRWPGLVRWTGSHAESVRAVCDGYADIASVDALTLAYLRRDRPADVATLIELGRGPWVPSLPIVVRRGDAAGRIDDLRAAIAAAVDDPDASSVRAGVAHRGVCRPRRSGLRADPRHGRAAMKSSAQVVVIGGGVVGASVLYHLTEAGWADVVLVERKELSAGSTWHSAGGMHTLNGDPNVAKLQQYTIQLYRTIEERSGQDCSIHLPGGLMLAGDRERLDWLRMAQARGRYLGMELDIISPAEAKAMFPLMEEQYFVGALFDPVEGHLDPTSVTNAYTVCARQGGAEVYRHTWVSDLRQRSDGTWDVITDRGEIHAEHIVNAGGLWAREVGRMIGLELPVLGMEHMYLVTDEMPEVAAYNAASGHEMPMALDFDGEIYIRQEQGGMLLGTYEQACVPWSPRDGAVELRHGAAAARPRPHRPLAGDRLQALPGDGDCADQTGRQRTVHVRPGRQPARRPDSRAAQLLGRLRRDGRAVTGRRGRPRPRQLDDDRRPTAGRVGDGRRPLRRLGDARLHQRQGARELQPAVPHHVPQRGATGRTPLHMTPVYDRLTAHNAVWGAGFGLEHALWFQRPGAEPVEEVTFRRSNAFPVVSEECRTVRERVGLTECSNYAKYRVSGDGAAEWLQGLFTNRVPKVGRIALTPMLNPDGRIVGEFSVSRVGDDDFFLFGSQAAEVHHSRWFLAHLPRALSDPLRRARALARRALARRAAGPRRAAVGDSRVSRDRRFLVHGVPPYRRGNDPGVGRADDLHRRPRLRAVGRPRAPAGAVRPAVGRRAETPGWRCSGSAP